MDPNCIERIQATPLPPELLLSIFRYATDVPGTRAPLPDIYDNANILGPLFIAKYHAALQEAVFTKYALFRVCKQWWHVGLPILYESIYINSLSCLSTLSDTLNGYVNRKGMAVATCRLGEYTQRLDVSFEFYAEVTYAGSLLLATVIKCMPRLAIFSIYIANNYASSSLASEILWALQWCTSSLRVLDWSSPNLELPLDSTISLLDQCSQLRVLNLPSVLWHRRNNELVVPPTVTTLRTRSLCTIRSTPTPDFGRIRLPIPAPRSLPGLREVILDCSGEDYEPGYLIKTYGSQLTSIHLYKPIKFEDEICPSLERFAQTCPNLRRLTITSVHFLDILETWYASESEIDSDPEDDPDSISPRLTNTYLGLRLYQTSKLDFKALFRLFEYARRSMPSLQVIQLLNERNLRCLLGKYHKFAVCALYKFMEAGRFVRVEDRNGVLLTERLTELN